MYPLKVVQNVIVALTNYAYLNYRVSSFRMVLVLALSPTCTLADYNDVIEL